MVSDCGFAVYIQQTRSVVAPRVAFDGIALSSADRYQLFHFHPGYVQKTTSA